MRAWLRDLQGLQDAVPATWPPRLLIIKQAQVVVGAQRKQRAQARQQLIGGTAQLLAGLHHTPHAIHAVQPRHHLRWQGRQGRE